MSYKIEQFTYKFWCGNKRNSESTGLGTPSGVSIIIKANNEEEAIEKAKKMVKRDWYSLEEITN